MNQHPDASRRHPSPRLSSARLSSARRRALTRTVAVLGVVGASIGVSADVASSEPVPNNTLCHLLPVCDDGEGGGDETNPTDQPDIDLGIVEIDIDLDPAPTDEPAGPLGGLGDLGATVTVTDELLGAGNATQVDVDVESDDNGLTVTPTVDVELDAGDITIDLHQDAIASVGTRDGIVVNVDADNSTHLAAGGLTIVDNDTDVCGVQVVVTGSGHRSCDPPATSGSGGDALIDLDAAESVCGVNVAVLGSSSVDCDHGGAASGQTPAAGGLLDGDLTAALCGIEVAVIGSTSTNCGDTPTTDIGACFGIARLCESLIDIDGTLGLCGLGVAVLGSTDTDCDDDAAVDEDDGNDDGSDDGDDGDDGSDDGDEPDGDGSDDGDDSDEGADSGASDGDDESAGDPGRNGFTGGGAERNSGGLPLTGGSIALTLLLGAALSLIGYGLRRSAIRV